MTERRSIGEGSATAQRGWLPVGALLLGATLWGTLWYPLRLLESQGLGGLWSTLAIYAATLVVAPWLLRGIGGVGRHRVAWLVALAAASGWCNVAFILAVLDGTVMRVLLLFYLSPLWAVLLGHWLLGERIRPGAAVVLVLALAGAVIMLWDPQTGLPWPRMLSDWLALSSGFAFALNNVVIRRLDAVPLGVKTVVALAGVVVVALLGLLTTGLALPQASLAAWAGALLLGAVGMTLMTVVVQYGVTHLPIQRSSVILLFELVAGALSSYWLAGEVLRGPEWLGGVLIVAAAYVAARRVDPA